MSVINQSDRLTDINSQIEYSDRESDGAITSHTQVGKYTRAGDLINSNVMS